MGIQNVNSSSNAPEYKTPDDINLKPADVYNSQKIGNTLAGIENSVQRDLDNALQDGVIDNTEKNTLQAWLGQVKTLSKSISYIVSKTYEDYRTRLNNVIKKLETHTKTEENIASYEPKKTDAQQDKPQTKVTESTLRIPDRKFMALSDNKKEGERILTEYNKCIDDAYNSNRKIASNLKCFQAKYEEMLKTVASSIENDGTYKISNLYEQIESQIRYYSDLADKDAEENQENMVNTMTHIPSNPSVGEIAAAKRPEGPDPRADWVKIVNPD